MNYLAVAHELERAGDFDEAMNLFEDETSRKLLIQIMTYRILGAEHYRLPGNTPAYWDRRRAVTGHIIKRAVAENVPCFGTLDEFEYKGIRLIAHPLTILNTFFMEQYRCLRAGIGVRRGDVVIDGGACWGDSALYFAREADRVFAFECVPFNIALFGKNMSSNPALAAKIELIERALWDSSGKDLQFADAGSGSRAVDSGATVQVETSTIDDLVRERNLDRIDFIKMDIEGAEVTALRGAEQTIRRFRPRLAICVYHSIADFARIPAWIAGLDLGYRLYLDHFTIYGEETICFATADER